MIPSTIVEEVVLDNRKFTIKRFIGTTDQGSFWVEFKRNPIGELGKSHWFTRDAAYEFIFRFNKQLKKVENKMNNDKEIIKHGIELLTDMAHKASADSGWWNHFDGEDLLTADPRYAPYVIATKIALTHSEVSEAMEGDRRDSMDDKLPHRSMLEVELADVIIRVLDIAGKLNLDVAGALVEKMDFNAVRPDHQVSNRRKPGGKKY